MAEIKTRRITNAKRKFGLLKQITMSAFVSTKKLG